MLCLGIGTCPDNLFENDYPKNVHLPERKFKGGNGDIPG